MGERRRARPGEPKEFFMEHLLDEVDECVLWPFGLDQDGYGVLPVNQRVHILACLAAHGPKAPGQEVLHSCDNAACFNRRHVRWGTHQENEDEKTKRGRRPIKLTAQQVQAIVADPRTTRVIAKDYGIDHGYVAQLKKGNYRAT